MSKITKLKPVYHIQTNYGYITAMVGTQNVQKKQKKMQKSSWNITKENCKTSINVLPELK